MGFRHTHFCLKTRDELPELRFDAFIDTLVDAANKLLSGYFGPISLVLMHFEAKSWEFCAPPKGHVPLTFLIYFCKNVIPLPFVDQIGYNFQGLED